MVNKQTVAGFLVLMTCLLAVYSNVYDMEFVYDDEFYIVKNEFLRSFSNIKKIMTQNSTAGSGFRDSFYRPIQFVFYLMVEQIGGGSKQSYHALNVILHILNAFLLFILGMQLGLKRWAAFAAALLWGLHPVHTEVIAYISGTADPLQCFFSLSALIIFLLKKRYSLFLMLISFMLALLSKEVAIVFPGLLAAVIFMTSTSSQRKSAKTYLPVLWSLLIAIIYLAVRYFLLNFNGDFSFYKQENIYTQSVLVRFYTFLATLPKYLELLFYPHDLHIDRAFPVFPTFFHAPVLLGAAIVVSVLALNIYAICRKREWRYWVIMLTSWFFIAHSIHTGIALPINSFFLEHWLYVPSMAFFWAWGLAIQSVPTKIGTPLLFLCAMALGFVTHQQNRMWENPITLFRRILEYNPRAARVRHNLAMAYSNEGQDELARSEYMRVLEEGAPYPQTHHNLALLYLKKQDETKAEEHLLKAIQTSPQFLPAYEYLILLYRSQNKGALVEEWTQRYLREKKNQGF